MVSEPNQPKPVTDWWKPELVALPELTIKRRVFRLLFRYSMKALTFLLMRKKVRGLENFPKKGPAVIVFNHLGDTDAGLLAAVLPNSGECIGKIELNEHRVAGPLFRAYGFIWIHRGQADRRAMRAALDALLQGRMLALAPEGRQTVIGGLEEGTEGAAFLAVKSGAPVVPVAITGTENDHVYSHLKQWKRIPVSLTVGKPFVIEKQADRQEMIRAGTRQIMEAIARLLPPEKRGIYSYVSDETSTQ